MRSSSLNTIFVKRYGSWKLLMNMWQYIYFKPATDTQMNCSVGEFSKYTVVSISLKSYYIEIGKFPNKNIDGYTVWYLSFESGYVAAPAPQES